LIPRRSISQICAIIGGTPRSLTIDAQREIRQSIAVKVTENASGHIMNASGNIVIEDGNGA
jgi:hypothetical protein